MKWEQFSSSWNCDCCTTKVKAMTKDANNINNIDEWWQISFLNKRYKSKKKTKIPWKEKEIFYNTNSIQKTSNSKTKHSPYPLENEIPPSPLCVFHHSCIPISVFFRHITMRELNNCDSTFRLLKHNPDLQNSQNNSEINTPVNFKRTQNTSHKHFTMFKYTTFSKLKQF